MFMHIDIYTYTYILAGKKCYSECIRGGDSGLLFWIFTYFSKVFPLMTRYFLLSLRDLEHKHFCMYMYNVQSLNFPRTLNIY